MKTSLPLLTFITCGLCQSFEPADFNVTEALLDNGVNVSALPDLSGLAERSALSACSLAVSLTHPLYKIARTKDAV
jgi:hypothetical protein